MKNTPEREPHIEEEPLFMNNFRHYLPGGSYAIDYGQFSKNDKVIDAVNKLLTDEFTNIDPAKIWQKHNEALTLSNRAMELGEEFEDLSDDESDELFEKSQRLSKEIDEELRPLFNRLIKMGFDYSLLVT